VQNVDQFPQFYSWASEISIWRSTLILSVTIQYSLPCLNGVPAVR